jgi:DNA-binding MarR family transcriptional regulator
MPDKKALQDATEADPGSDSILERFFGYNLKRAYLLIHSDFRTTMGEDGLSPRVFSVLVLVVERPDITQSEIARHLGIERSGLVSLIDELETLGYVKRVPVPGDRRVQALVPTDAGKAATRSAVKRVLDHEKALLSHLTDDEQETLLNLLRKIRHNGSDVG